MAESSDKEHQMTTNEIRLRHGSEFILNHQTSKQNYRDIDEDLLGIRIRIYIPLPSGGAAMKEFSFPSDLVKKTEWNFSDKLHCNLLKTHERKESGK